MKIGVKLPNSGPFAEARHIARIAVEVERLGFDSLWVHDHVTRSAADAEHHFVFGAVEEWERPVVPNVYEAITTLAYVAGLTKRVQLGTSCIVLPLRNPVWLAKMAATIDNLSGGRFVLCVGVGGTVYVKTELEAIGDGRLHANRGKVVDEWIDVIRKVWSEPKVTHAGQFIQVTDAEVFPKPAQKRMPLWIAGGSKIARARVAARGDGWLPMFLRPDELRSGIAEIRELATKAGRDGNAIALASEHWMSIDTDAARARRRALPTISGMTEYTVEIPGAAYDTKVNVGRDEIGNLLGHPDEIAKRVGEYRDAGVEHLILRVIAHSIDEAVASLQLFKERVYAPVVA